MNRFLKLVLTTALGGLLAASSLLAGNIALTGHDSDYHYYAGSAAGNQIAAMVAFARSGAPNPAKPVLVFDQRTELTNALTALGIPFTNVNPNAGIPAASLFDVANYSAMVVASDQSCGGCDNDTTSSTNIAGASAAIAAFFNAGGGIVAFAGGSNLGYYNFVPASASGFGSPPSSGYVQTTFGAGLAIPPVNGNATHNFFYEPGTSGVSAAYGVVERLGDPATGTVETIACRGCTVSGGGLIGGTGGGAGHTISCVSGPFTTDVPVHSATITSTLTAPVTYAITAGNLGIGLTMTSAGVISGTPGLRGNFPYKIRATSGTTSVEQHCLLTINAPTPPPGVTPGPIVGAPMLATACPLADGAMGIAATRNLVSTGGTAPISFSLASGILPPGLTLSSAGVISGTPVHPGVFAFSLMLTDASTPALSSVAPCSMIITTAPLVPPVAGSPVVVTSACPLPSATEGSAYSTSLTASGGTGTYSFFVTAGALPRPMRVTLAGFLSGTPYHRGAYTFTLLAQDTAGVTGTKACSMVVNAPGTPGLMALASGIAAGSFRYGTETEDGVIPVTLELAESLPYDVTGRMSMMHAAADQVRSDESIRFTNGGHDVDFVIPAGETKARFINDELGVRLGDRTGDVILSAVIESANAHTVIDANGTEIVPKSQQQ